MFTTFLEASYVTVSCEKKAFLPHYTKGGGRAFREGFYTVAVVCSSSARSGASLFCF